MYRYTQQSEQSQQNKRMKFQEEYEVDEAVILHECISDLTKFINKYEKCFMSYKFASVLEPLKMIRKALHNDLCDSGIV